MNSEGPKAATVAIGMAALAVLMSLIALVVVARRSPKGSELEVVPFETTVGAEDVVKLRSNVELAKDEGGVIGVRVTDEKLRAALGLKVGDVLTAFAGRPIKSTELGDALAGASMLEPTVLYVDVLREGEPVLLRWTLDGDLRAARRGDLGNVPRTDPVDLDGVTKIDDFNYQIEKSVVDSIASNPLTFTRGARVVPAMSMGKVEGYKLYAIRPNSIFSKLGFSNGDLIREINGFALTSADQALEVYAKLRDATSLEIALTRRGRDETIRITIR